MSRYYAGASATEQPSHPPSFHTLSRMVDSPVGIGKRDESKFRTRIHDQVLRHSTHVDHAQTSPLHPLDDKVTVRNGVHRVFANTLESEFGPEKFPVKRIWISG